MEKEQTPAEFLEAAMQATGLTLAALAEASGYEERTLKRIRSGEVKLSKFVRTQIDGVVARGTHPLSKFGTLPMRVTSFADRLTAWRGRVNLSEGDAARTLGIGLVKYRDLERGREPAPTLAAKFAEIEFEGARVAEEALGERYERIREQQLESNGVSTNPGVESGRLELRKIPVIGWAQAGALAEYEDVVDWDNAVTIVTRNSKAFAIQVRGDSMMPLISEGDLVVVSPGDPPANERYVVARLRGGGVVCKQYRRISETQIELRSLNQFYAPIVVLVSDVVWMYPVANLIKTL